MKITAMALAPVMALAGTAAQAEVMEVAPDGVVMVLADRPNASWSSNEKTTISSDKDAALTIISGDLGNSGYVQALQQAARAYNISPHLLEALIWQESRWNQAAVSRAGAIGLTQLMPGTARELGVDPRDPVQNIIGGARYLRQQLDRFDGNVEKALAAYNAGPGRVARAGGIPNIQETKAYVRAIVARLAAAATHQGEAR